MHTPKLASLIQNHLKHHYTSKVQYIKKGIFRLILHLWELKKPGANQNKEYIFKREGMDYLIMDVLTAC